MDQEGILYEKGLEHIYVRRRRYRSLSGTRILRVFIADLTAAIASKNHGTQLIRTLVKEYL